MLIDSRIIPKNQLIQTDICIIGSGAAGITIAREFINQNFQVCLMESGGFEYNDDTQSLYDGINVGLDLDYDLKGSRLRYFGGTTNHWAGYCRPFDDIDFEKRDWVPNSGWPFKKSILNDYYNRAEKICNIGPFSYLLSNWDDVQPTLLFNNEVVNTKFFQLSDDVTKRFGKFYKDEIINAANIDTYLYANALDIETNYNAKTVKKVKFSTLENNIFGVSAKYFVLATGGIENARILLLSHTVQKNGLGNENDLVGRYFMEHQEFSAALYLPSQRLPMNFPRALKIKRKQVPGNTSGILTLSENIMEKEKLLNFTCEISKEDIGFISETLNKKTDGISSHIRNIINYIDNLNNKTQINTKDEISQKLRLYALINASEQIPNPNSRISLSHQLDRFNKRKVKLDWKLSEFDRKSLVKSYEIIGREIARSGYGRLMLLIDKDYDNWDVKVEGQRHHMGTTRMHNDPKKGVVDKNCKVHSINNLFIAGSSVFPTSSSATPTFTIIALAVRLADYIKQQLK